MVRDTKNRVVGGLKGTKLVWFCLCDDDGTVRTRLGAIAICKDCDISKIDCEALKKTLIESPLSGVPPDMYEFSKFKKMKLELVKTYGE